jgi:hypothetical protein
MKQYNVLLHVLTEYISLFCLCIGFATHNTDAILFFGFLLLSLKEGSI